MPRLTRARQWRPASRLRLAGLLADVAALIFLPPTLVAGIYGMNVAYMPELKWLLGYPMALEMSRLSAVLPLWVLKRTGWI